MLKLINRFFNKSRKINNQPLNFGGLLVIILVDIFILYNVFSGLNDISQRYISPDQSYPCYSQWQGYLDQVSADKNYEIIRDIVSTKDKLDPNYNYQPENKSHLGQINTTCLKYANYHDQVKKSGSQALINNIDNLNLNIKELEKSNYTIRSQYSSSLLEKIAGQKQENSINQVSAEKARQQLLKNDTQIAQFKREIKQSKTTLLTSPVNTKFIDFLNQKDTFKTLKDNYEQSNFWYPTIQLLLQALFLVPLIILAYWLNNFAQAKGYGLVSLITWHLLIIFIIPLLVKIFQFLQIGLVFRLIFDFVHKILGGLLFLINYFYILIIPLVGYGIIKFSQRVARKPKNLNQAAINLQYGSCLNCAKKIRPQDSYCPHCGYAQYCQCSNCQALTYKLASYCKECGYFNE